MGKIPNELRETIARNIRECRMKKFPGRGGGKKCAEEFGVSPQQWSPWERGMRTPDELRLEAIAAFFDKNVEYMRRDHRKTTKESQPETPDTRSPNGFSTDPLLENGLRTLDQMMQYGINEPPGSAASFYWLARYFVMSVIKQGVRIDRQCIDYLVEKLGNRETEQ